MLKIRLAILFILCLLTLLLTHEKISISFLIFIIFFILFFILINKILYLILSFNKSLKKLVILLQFVFFLIIFLINSYIIYYFKGLYFTLFFIFISLIPILINLLLYKFGIIKSLYFLNFNSDSSINPDSNSSINSDSNSISRIILFTGSFGAGFFIIMVSIFGLSRLGIFIGILIILLPLFNKKNNLFK